MFNAITRVIHRITLYAAAVGTSMLLIMMFLTTSDAIARKLLAPIPGTYELDKYMLAIFGLLGLGYVQQVRGHVSISLLTERMPPRTQLVIDSLMTLISLLFFAVVIWWGWVEAIISVEAGTTSDILNIPLGPFKFLVSIGAFLLCLELLLTLIASVRAIGKTSPDKEVMA